MALTEQIDRIDTITAAADLAANTFVGFDGDVCGANAKALGKVIYDTTSGGQAAAAVEGRVLLIAGGTVAVGDPVASDANGKAIKADALQVASGATQVTSTAANGSILTGGATPQAINGYAMSAGTSGDLIQVILK